VSDRSSMAPTISMVGALSSSVGQQATKIVCQLADCPCSLRMIILFQTLSLQSRLFRSRHRPNQSILRHWSFPLTPSAALQPPSLPAGTLRNSLGIPLGQVICTSVVLPLTFLTHLNFDLAALSSYSFQGKVPTRSIPRLFHRSGM